MHVIPTAVPSHVDNQTFYGMLCKQSPEMVRFFLKVFIRPKIHIDSLRIRQIGDPKGCFGMRTRAESGRSA